jgi:hypothetical protein
MKKMAAAEEMRVHANSSQKGTVRVSTSTEGRLPRVRKRNNSNLSEILESSFDSSFWGENKGNPWNEDTLKPTFHVRRK